MIAEDSVLLREGLVRLLAEHDIDVVGTSETADKLLVLVADIARKYDPSLAEFRQRLLDKGMPIMQVRVALARKLLVRLNAKARETRAALAA